MTILRFLFIVVLALCQTSDISWNEDVIAHHFASDFNNRLNPNQVSANSSGLYYQALKVKNPQALLQYYLHNQNLTDQQKLAWLTQENLSSNWQANWLLGQYWLEQKQLTQARSWMVSALETYRLNTERRSGVEYAELLLQLVDVLQQLKDYQGANKLLNDDLLVDEHISVSLRSRAAYLRAKGLMLEGNLHQAKDLLDGLFVRFGLDLVSSAKLLRQEIHGLIYEQHQTPQCAVKVQLLASDYSQWRYAHSLLVKWKKEPKLSLLPICFKPIQFFDAQPLACRDKDKLRLSCDLTMMAKHLPLEHDVLPVLVHGQSGVANYNNGIIFTNLSKTYGVFVHELFHHFGFIDEYRLPLGIGSKVCNVTKPTFRGANLVVVPTSDVEDFKQSKLYLRYFTPVDTCDRFDSVAFKLSPQMTIMGYMDQQVPDSYIHLARNKMLSSSDSMSNYQYAYALAFEYVSDIKNYQIWLRNSAKQGYKVADALLAE